MFPSEYIDRIDFMIWDIPKSISPPAAAREKSKRESTVASPRCAGPAPPQGTAAAALLESAYGGCVPLHSSCLLIWCLRCWAGSLGRQKSCNSVFWLCLLGPH